MVYRLFSLMFKVFFVAAAAYLLRRRGALTAQDQKSVTNVLMRFVVYFTVIMSSQQDFSLKAAKAAIFSESVDKAVSVDGGGLQADYHIAELHGTECRHDPL